MSTVLQDELIAIAGVQSEKVVRNARALSLFMLIPPLTPMGILLLSFVLPRERRNAALVMRWLRTASEEVRWVYPKLTTVNGLSKLEVYLCGSTGGSRAKGILRLSGLEPEVQQSLVDGLAALFPWAVIGYSKEAEKAFRSGALQAGGA